MPAEGRYYCLGRGRRSPAYGAVDIRHEPSGGGGQEPLNGIEVVKEVGHGSLSHPGNRPFRAQSRP